MAVFSFTLILLSKRQTAPTIATGRKIKEIIKLIILSVALGTFSRLLKISIVRPPRPIRNGADKKSKTLSLMFLLEYI